MMRSERQQGFTLLEVMIALTLTGLALGGLFGIIAGNKQLAWRADAALVRSMQVRSLINFSQLNDTRGDVPVPFAASELQLSDNLLLPEVPERRTQGSVQSLRRYQVLDQNGEELAAGTYHVELDLPE